MTNIEDNTRIDTKNVCNMYTNRRTIGVSITCYRLGVHPRRQPHHSRRARQGWAWGAKGLWAYVERRMRRAHTAVAMWGHSTYFAWSTRMKCAIHINPVALLSASWCECVGACLPARENSALSSWQVGWRCKWQQSADVRCMERE